VEVTERRRKTRENSKRNKLRQENLDTNLLPEEPKKSNNLDPEIKQNSATNSDSREQKTNHVQASAPMAPQYQTQPQLVNPNLFYNGLFFGDNNPLANYFMYQKPLAKIPDLFSTPLIRREEQKERPKLKRTGSHIDIAHYIDSQKKLESNLNLTLNNFNFLNPWFMQAQMSQGPRVMQEWRGVATGENGHPELSFGMNEYNKMLETWNAQKMMQPMQ